MTTVDDLMALADKIQFAEGPFTVRRELRAAIEAALSERGRDAKPVAYIKNTPSGQYLRSAERMAEIPEADDEVTRSGWTPLYASPPLPVRATEREQDAEPVAWFCGESGNLREVERWAEGAFPVYASPPKRKGLSTYELDNLWIRRPSIHDGELMPQLRDFARAVELAHGIGETTKL